MIRMRRVTKVYKGNVYALEDVTLDIEKGEFVFLVGPSGSGKTTFIKLLIREEEPTAGQIYIADTNINQLRKWKVPYLRRKIGCVFQDFKLLPDRTVMENVALALKVQGVPPKQMLHRAYQALRAVGLADKRDQKPLRLSGGEQQRVAIARALVNEPFLLLADEPTGNLDRALSREIMEQFLRIHETGTTILVATHNEGLIDFCGKGRIVLEKGRLVAGP